MSAIVASSMLNVAAAAVAAGAAPSGLSALARTATPTRAPEARPTTAHPSTKNRRTLILTRLFIRLSPRSFGNGSAVVGTETVLTGDRASGVPRGLDRSPIARSSRNRRVYAGNEANSRGNLELACSDMFVATNRFTAKNVQIGCASATDGPVAGTPQIPRTCVDVIRAELGRF